MKLFYDFFSASRLIRVFSLIILISAFLIIGCSKDDDPTGPENNDNPGGNIAVNSIVINGGGYSNKSVSFMLAQGSYSVSDALTGCVLSGNTEIMSVTMVFPGNQSGSSNWDDYIANNNNATSGIVLVIGGSTSAKTFAPKFESGTTNITAFGAVNGKIDGNFSGTLYNPANESEQITINCNFSINRLPDSE